MSVRSAWSVGGKIAVSALCLGFLGVRFARDPSWRAALGRLEGGAFMLAFCLLGLGLVLSAVRSMILLRARGANVGLARSTHLYFVGYFFNTLLPTTVGGDVVRAWALRNAAPLELVAGSILLERVLGFACLLGLAIAGSFALESTAPARPVLIAAGVAFTAGIVSLFVIRWPADSPPPGAGRARRLSAWCARIAGEARAFGEHKTALAAGIVLSFAWQVILIAVNAILSRGMGGACPLASLFVLVPVVQVISMLPISVGGLGIRELGYAALFRLSGQDPGEGAALGLAWLAVSSMLALAGGIVFLVRPVSWRAR